MIPDLTVEYTRTAWQPTLVTVLLHVLTIADLMTNCISGLQDVLRFCLFGLVVHFFILLPYMIKANAHHPTWSSIVVRTLSYVVNAVPAGIVTIMVCNGIIARVRLGKDGLLLMFPECLRLGADLDLVCFDKTGTLTHRNVGALSLDNPILFSVHATAVVHRHAVQQLLCRLL